MFTEDADAVLFSSEHELLSKVRALLADPDRRGAIAAAGRHRVLRDGHSVDDRAREWLAVVDAALRQRDADRAAAPSVEPKRMHVGG
jgi:spore maturation protein CgeB